MRQKSLVLTLCLFLVPFNNVLSGDEIAYSEQAWPEKRIESESLSLGTLQFHVPERFSASFVGEQMLVFKNAENDKIIFTQHQRHELAPSIKDAMQLQNWAQVVFEPSEPDDSIDYRLIAEFRRVLLDQTEEIRKFQHRELTAYLFSGKQQAPYPIVVMLLDATQEQVFYLLEVSIASDDITEQALSGIQVAKENKHEIIIPPSPAQTESAEPGLIEAATPVESLPNISTTEPTALDEQTVQTE
ncbi:MAG: hypothetical protein OEZ43_17690 [Gammaproteobacteria bacterium]|nr:hypothetical protein [Gammaproteobacteria bacterium]